MMLFLAPLDLRRLSLGLWQGKAMAVREEIHVTPEEIAGAVSDFLSRHKQHIDDLGGILVANGPGSATALRSGISVANTLAFIYDLPLFAVPEIPVSIEGLVPVLALSPVYAHPPHITMPKAPVDELLAE